MSQHALHQVMVFCRPWLRIHQTPCAPVPCNIATAAPITNTSHLFSHQPGMSQCCSNPAQSSHPPGHPPWLTATPLTSRPQCATASPASAGHTQQPPRAAQPGHSTAEEGITYNGLLLFTSYAGNVMGQFKTCSGPDSVLNEMVEQHTWTKYRSKHMTNLANSSTSDVYLRTSIIDAHIPITNTLSMHKICCTLLSVHLKRTHARTHQLRYT